MISSKPTSAFSSSKLALSSKDRTGLRECVYGVHGTGGKKGIKTVAGPRQSQQSNLRSRCYFKWGCGSPRLSTLIGDRNYAEGRTARKIIYKKYYMCASSKHKYGPEPKSHHSSHSKELLASLLKTLDAFHRFSRPHTIMGTVVGITSVSLLPIESMVDLSPVFFIGLFKAILPAIFMNIYIVGLNQLFDVEIDKINKPTLPLASGEFSREMGIVIVAAFCMMSFFMGIKSQSPPLLSALLVSYFLGTAYSIDLPLLRWKQHAFLAASCILCVRAILVQLAFFVHMQRYVLGRSVTLTKSVIFATIFMCFFSAVIALFKDIPDVDGDRNFGIRSFSVRLGEERVFWLCIKLLLAAYGIAMIVGVSSVNIYHRFVTVFGHAFLAYVLWFHAQSIDIQNKESITSFYMFIWKLFYAEYLLVPFVR